MVSSIKIKENEEYKNLLDLFFPVGSIYLTISSTSPSAYLGGTWVKIEAGFLAIAGKISGSAFNTNFANAGAFAGSLYLEVSQIPGHTHGVGTYSIADNTHKHALPRATLHNASTQSYESYPFQPYTNTTHWIWETTQNDTHSHTLSGKSASTGGKILCPTIILFMHEGEQPRSGDYLCLN